MQPRHSVDDYLNRDLSDKWCDHAIVTQHFINALIAENKMVAEYIERTHELEFQLAIHKSELFIADGRLNLNGGMGRGKGTDKAKGGKGKGRPRSAYSTTPY
jgi:hypothetical protein